MDTVSGQCDRRYIGAICNHLEREFFKDMIPAKFAPLLFSFFVDHYFLCGVGCGNAERGRLVAFLTILVVALVSRRFVADVTGG